MERAAALQAQEQLIESSAERAVRLPWYIIAMALGATSVVVGVVWDISWHKTIGRDTFWTPAHMAIYLGGIIGGFGGGWLALKNTFGQSAAATVRFWGFRAPLGAWMTIWGAIAMLTSAPFDDWWHNAYGLDVEILSPPHSVLAAGIIAIIVGALILALAHHNRGRAEGAPSRPAVYLYVAALLVWVMAILVMEETHPNRHHGTPFYLIVCGIFPFFLVGLAHAVRLRWAATIIAALYMFLTALTIWILPLFPAQPMLAPIYNPVDYMVPQSFPLLLIVPALVLDLGLRFAGRGKGRDALLALAMGTGFFVVFLAAQWPFASFYLSPASDNWFLGGHRFWSYDARPGEWMAAFWGDPIGFGGAVGAIGMASLSAWLGLGWGRWMAKVRR